MDYSKKNKEQVIDGIKNDILYAAKNKHKRRGYKSIRELHRTVQKEMKKHDISYSEILIQGKQFSKIEYYNLLAEPAKLEAEVLKDIVMFLTQKEDDNNDYSIPLNATYLILENSSENLVKAKDETTRPVDYDIMVARYQRERALRFLKKLDKYQTTAQDLLANNNINSSIFKKPPTVPEDLLELKDFIIEAINLSGDPQGTFRFHNYESKYIRRKKKPENHSPIEDVVTDILYNHLQLYVKHMGEYGKEIAYYRAFTSLISEHKLNSSYLRMSPDEMNKMIYVPVSNAMIPFFVDVRANVNNYISQGNIKSVMRKLHSLLCLLPKKARIEFLDSKGYSYQQLQTSVQKRMQKK